MAALFADESRARGEAYHEHDLLRGLEENLRFYVIIFSGCINTCNLP